jgi:hypothetical protein
LLFESGNVVFCTHLLERVQAQVAQLVSAFPAQHAGKTRPLHVRLLSYFGSPPLAVPFLKEITVDVAKKSLMKITDICWITPLRNLDICWITHYRLLLAYPLAAADAGWWAPDGLSKSGWAPLSLPIQFWPFIGPQPLLPWASTLPRHCWHCL